MNRSIAEAKLQLEYYHKIFHNHNYKLITTEKSGQKNDGLVKQSSHHSTKKRKQKVRNIDLININFHWRCHTAVPVEKKPNKWNKTRKLSY